MASEVITCSTYVDYSSRKNCPMYNIDGCSTPEAPILCPMIENIPRSPCTRFICSAEAQALRSTTIATNIFSDLVTEMMSSVSKGMAVASEDPERYQPQVQVINLTSFLRGPF